MSLSKQQQQQLHALPNVLFSLQHTAIRRESNCHRWGAGHIVSPSPGRYVVDVVADVCRVSGCDLLTRAVELGASNYTELQCISWLRQICQGVAHMHNNNIIHLDLRVSTALPSNSALLLLTFTLPPYFLHRKPRDYLFHCSRLPSVL